ncbi:hypothetical protein [Hymenobacter busanensis]|nr:hypothetical protein [Hymenobacter busanensis]
MSRFFWVVSPLYALLAKGKNSVPVLASLTLGTASNELFLSHS